MTFQEAALVWILQCFYVGKSLLALLTWVSIHFEERKDCQSRQSDLWYMWGCGMGRKNLSCTYYLWPVQVSFIPLDDITVCKWLQMSFICMVQIHHRVANMPLIATWLRPWTLDLNWYSVTNLPSVLYGVLMLWNSRVKDDEDNGCDADDGKQSGCWWFMLSSFQVSSITGSDWRLLLLNSCWYVVMRPDSYESRLPKGFV